MPEREARLTRLHAAVARGDTAAVVQILARGKKRRLQQQYQVNSGTWVTWLDVAVGAASQRTGTLQGQTPLMVACSQGSLDIATA